MPNINKFSKQKLKVQHSDENATELYVLFKRVNFMF